MKNLEILLTKQPTSEILKKYISYYYIHSSNDSKDVKKIIYYPNTLNALTIYKNSELTFINNFSIAKPTKRETYNLYYGGIQKMYRIAEMQGVFNKIGVVFEPLGINFFIKRPLSDLISKTSDLSFNYFDTSILPTLKNVYKTENLDKKVTLLDQYFESQLNDFKVGFLEKSLSLIHSDSPKYKVYQLADEVATTQKTLSRKFNKHLNCTVKDYIEVAQFRKSFNDYFTQGDSKTLGDLAYKFNYYDQSDFINQFKKITGINPKKLFSSVEQFGNEELFWNTKI